MSRRHVCFPVYDVKVMRSYACSFVIYHVVYAEQRRYDAPLVKNAEQQCEDNIRHSPDYLQVPGVSMISMVCRRDETLRRTQNNFPARRMRLLLTTSAIIGVIRGIKKRGSWWGCIDSSVVPDHLTQ